MLWPSMAVDIAAALNASRLAHEAYRAAVPHKRHDGGQIAETAGDATAARAALQEALDARLRAETADPQHADPAWANDPAPSGDLIAFYREQLAR